MKLNKKIIVPAFALLAGASLVGSISGTVAWYQYSTRANVSYIGSSAGVIGNLQLKIRGASGEAGEFGPTLNIDDVRNYLSAQNIGQEVEPVTPGALAKNDSLKKLGWEVASEDILVDDGAPVDDLGHAYYFDSAENKLYSYDDQADEWNEEALNILDATPNANSVNYDDYYNSADNKIYHKSVSAEKDFYVNPRFGIASYDKWLKASNANFVRLPLQFRFIGDDENDLEAREIYLSKLLIQADRNNGTHGDISDAIRVHFSSYVEGDEIHAVNHLVSKKGGTTLTHGKLKLGRGSDFDKAYAEDDEFGFNGSTYDYVNYGEGVQNSYGAIVNAEQGVYYEEEAPASGWKQLSILSGVVAPEDENGNDGDFYLDTAANKLYKKEAGAWAEFDSANYLSGAEDPDLDTENTGNLDYFFNTATNKLFLRALPTEETISPALVSSVEDSLEIGDLTADKVFGETVATSDPQKYLNVDVTIWVEGWHKFNNNGSYSAIWDKDLIGAMFDVGMQFAVQDIR